VASNARSSANRDSTVASTSGVGVVVNKLTLGGIGDGVTDCELLPQAYKLTASDVNVMHTMRVFSFPTRIAIPPNTTVTWLTFAYIRLIMRYICIK